MKSMNPIIDHDRRSNHIFKTAMSCIHEPLLIINPRRSRFIEFNKKAAEFLGYSKSDLLDLPIDRVFSQKQQCLDSLLTSWNTPVMANTQVLNKDNQLISVVLTGCSVEYFGEQAVILLIDDLKSDGEIKTNDDILDITRKCEASDDVIETYIDFPSIVGQSEQIREVCRLIGLVAKTDATVLIQGETGTGKELVAQAIHFHSNRAKGPLIELNCSALTETLLESELFGHKKGAFTGAVQDRKGRFSLADGGTIILDEINSMSLNGQSKLLRVLQEKVFEPLGSTKSIKVDVRVIAITNSNLLEDIGNGTFRDDLYYRLNAFPILLPPLRDRKRDIPFLARTFLKRYSTSMKKQIDDLDMEILSLLMNYAWPGNIRELENVIEYAVILEKGGVLKKPSLPENFQYKNDNKCSLKQSMEIAEKQFILDALSQSNGIKKHASELLGIDRRNLSYFLHKHEIN